MLRFDELTIPARPGSMQWGSDAVAEALAALGVPYISLCPGSSYRGLHDSLVNHLGNEGPRIFVTLHEEHAVAVAHGYAKVTGEPLAVGLHSNVGLMHATMAIYNAWCDRVPMLVIGATGPLDAAKRRPWIDWIHTATDQGALIRAYTKWDDQPGSAEAAVRAVIHAVEVTRSYPTAPTYVCLDAAQQESRLAAPIEVPDVERFQPPSPPAPGPEEVGDALAILARARRPLILAGRVSRDDQAWDERVTLAERLGAAVLTDLKTAGAFPTGHRLHAAVPGTFLTSSGHRLVTQADAILSLDWVDLAGTLQAGPAGPAATIISVSSDQTLHNGWSQDHFGLAPAELRVAAHPDRFVSALLKELPADLEPRDPAWAVSPPPGAPPAPVRDAIHLRELAAALRTALADRPHTLVRLPLGWDGADLQIEGPLDYLGQDGGGGVGSGPGMAVGSALGLHGSGRLPVAILGDGDYLMGSSALWSAAHHGLPLLVLIANNRSFFNDEVHQERVAVTRGRPVENRWIGQHIRNPVPDLAASAIALGLRGHGPVQTLADLEALLPEAIAQAADGPVLIDVHTTVEGYPGGASGNSSGGPRGAG
jgi:thiamine pyrophosphate-dependent acetolactate synthase large subunit-like protein